MSFSKILMFVCFYIFLTTSIYANEYFAKSKSDDLFQAKAELKNCTVWFKNNTVIFDYHSIEDGTEIGNSKIDIKQRYSNIKNKIDEKKLVGHIISLTFENALPNSFYHFVESYPTVNYILKNDNSTFQETFKKLYIKEIYSGIDIVFYFEAGSLRYDFIVAPFANPNQIKMRFEGEDNLHITEYNEIELLLSSKKIIHKDLFAYQKTMTNQTITTFAPQAEFIQDDNGIIGINVENYDNSSELIIDPIIYSSFIGGSANDIVNDIVVEGDYLYLVGTTLSTNFPTSTGAYSTSLKGMKDVFVSKINKNGNSIVYSTYIGGIKDDEGYGIDVLDGYAYITGYTLSNDFPYTDGCYQDNRDAGNSCFVMKLAQDGKSLVYGTFFGGDDEDESYAISVDKEGYAHFTGSTKSTDFPRLSAFQNIILGDYDAFVSKLSPDGKTLIYSTLIGGSSFDKAQDIDIDNRGNIYITGLTESDDFKTTAGVFQTSMNGFFAAFCSKINLSSTSLEYSTYFNGDFLDDASAITVDEQYKAYIAGKSYSDVSFPATLGAYKSDPDGTEDGFIAKFNANATALEYCTLIGGANGDESIYDIKLNYENMPIICGSTNADDFPVTNDAFQSSLAGGIDAIYTVLESDLSDIYYSAYIGGTGDETAFAMDYNSTIFLAGETSSSDFPITAAYQSTKSGNKDGWFCKMNL